MQKKFFWDKNEYTFEYFWSLYPGNHKKLTAKAFLATEQRIPGLGNGVLQDILWDAGIDPRFDMRSLSRVWNVGMRSTKRISWAGQCIIVRIVKKSKETLIILSWFWIIGHAEFH